MTNRTQRVYTFEDCKLKESEKFTIKSWLKIKINLTEKSIGCQEWLDSKSY